jgi:hypothetical protein
MQRNVPQFIDIEEKIFGPFTLKQFGFLMGGFGICVVVWRSMPLSVGVFFMGPAIGASLALAFGTYNTKPFIDIVRAGISHVFKSKEYRWESPSERVVRERHVQAEKDRKKEEEIYNKSVVSKKYSTDDIKNLASRLDNKI